MTVLAIATKARIIDARLMNSDGVRNSMAKVFSMQPRRRPTNPVALPTRHLQGDASLHAMYPTFAPDGRLLAYPWLFNTGPFYVWDMNSGQRTTFTSGPGPYGFAFSPGNERIAIAREEEIEEEIHVLAWPSGQRITKAPFHRSDPDYLGLNLQFASADQLCVLYHPQGVWLWDLSSGQMKLHRRFAHTKWWQSGRWEVGDRLTWLDGRLVLYTKFRDSHETSACLKVELLDTGEEILRTISGGYFQFTSEHVLIVTEGGYGDCEVWDLVQGKRSGRVPAGTFGQGAYQGHWPLSPQGRFVAWRWESPEEEYCIKIWDTRQERLAQEIPTNGPYTPCCFSPTHWLLVAVANTFGRLPGPEDRTIILDPLTGVCLGETALHPFLLGQPDFSPCGRWFASIVPTACNQEWHDPPTGTVLLTDLASILPLASPVVRGGE